MKRKDKSYFTVLRFFLDGNVKKQIKIYLKSLNYKIKSYFCGSKFILSNIMSNLIIF